MTIGQISVASMILRGSSSPSDRSRSLDFTPQIILLDLLLTRFSVDNWRGRAAGRRDWGNCELRGRTNNVVFYGWEANPALLWKRGRGRGRRRLVLGFLPLPEIIFKGRRKSKIELVLSGQEVVTYFI